MTILKSFILGSVQGLTEFLPVSSSGHLVIIQNIFGLGSNIGFDVLLHFATVLAVLVYFRNDIFEMIKGIFGKSRTGLLYIKAIIVGSIPTAIIGLVFKKVFEEKFSQPKAVLAMLIITGVILFFASKYSRGKSGKEIQSNKITDFLLIGIFQGIAIMPGISRSGMTIASSMFLGFKKDWAFKYSMLLSVPAVLGAGILELDKIELSTVAVPGGITAFATGIAALYILSKFVIKEKIHIFSYYLWIAGILGLILL